jgi:uncharacterized membrane protein
MENQTVQQEDPGKIVAILSYCTLIGLIIALVMNSDQKNKSELGATHLRQGLGIICTSFAMMIVSFIFVFIPFIGWIIAMLINLSYIAIFVFWILGLIAAIQGEKKVVPVLGPLYQKIFAGIN